MKTIDKLKRLRDELQKEIYNSENHMVFAILNDFYKKFDSIIEAEERPDEAGETAEHILRHYYYYTDNSTFKHHAEESVLRAMEEYASLKVNQSKQIKALHRIENLMERWHHARDNDNETLQKINDELVGIGLLKWFNKDAPTNPENRDQFGIKGISKKPCDMCIYNKRTNLQICIHCTDNNEIQEYYKSKR